jgi:phosphoribosyl-AMP cyclohydrolase
MADEWLNEVKWDEHGLIPAIAQDAASGKVLMLAWMDRAALAATVATGEAVYYSRSRAKLWHKGEESGHTQKVREVRLDCDGDVVTLQIEQTGGIACHTGHERCFFRRLEIDEKDGDGKRGRWVETEAVIKDPGQIYK